MSIKMLLSAVLIPPILLACVGLSAVPTPTLTPSPQKAAALPSSTPLLPPTLAAGEAPFDLAWDDRSPFAAGLTSSYQGVLEQLPGASVYHLALSLGDPPTTLAGIEEVKYTNQETVPLEEVVFAVFAEILGGTFTLGKTSRDGQAITARHELGFLHFPLAPALEPGGSVVLQIEFSVTVPSLGSDAYYGIFGYNNGILSLAHACPTILVYDSQGWHDRLPDLDGDPLFTDTSFYLVSVDAPTNLILVASGVELKRSETDTRQRVLYADGPGRDFYLAASRDFVVRREKVGEVSLNSYAVAGQETYNRPALEAARSALQFFDAQYGPYPYTEFDIVPILTSAGGVEFSGMTAISSDLYNSDSGNFFEVVVVHEFGHQWFYNLVGNDNQNQPWLDEALVEFITWEYFAHRYGAQGSSQYEHELHFYWDGTSSMPIGLPVSAYDSRQYGEIVYGRGPFFFDALRDQIGQQTFDRLMRAYVQTYAWQVATADEFKTLAEGTCGCDLTPLFDQWVNP